MNKQLLLSSTVVVGFLSALWHAFSLLHTLPWTLVYSDVLVFFPKAAGIPYLQTPIEYPVLTGLFIWLAGTMGTLAGYYALTSAAFIAAALATIFALSKTHGVQQKHLLQFFILTPSLFIFLVYNWDIFAVAATTTALYFLSRQRPLSAVTLSAPRQLQPAVAVSSVPRRNNHLLAAAGLLAVGFSFKFYPALFLLPLLLKAENNKKRLFSCLVFVAVALGTNLPVIVAAPDGWSYFYRFSAERMPNFDSVWWLLSSLVPGLSVPVINMISLLLFAGGVTVLFWKKRQLSALQLCLPLLLLFLLTTKVFSPQYTLWLLPFFVLFPPGRKFYLLEVANLLVLFTILPWAFSSYPGFPWLSGFFVLVRHGALLLLLKDAVRQPAPVTSS